MAACETRRDQVRETVTGQQKPHWRDLTPTFASGFLTACIFHPHLPCAFACFVCLLACVFTCLALLHALFDCLPCLFTCFIACFAFTYSTACLSLLILFTCLFLLYFLHYACLNTCLAHYACLLNGNCFVSHTCYATAPAHTMHTYILI